MQQIQQRPPETPFWAKLIKVVDPEFMTMAQKRWHAQFHRPGQMRTVMKDDNVFGHKYSRIRAFLDVLPYLLYISVPIAIAAYYYFSRQY